MRYVRLIARLDIKAPNLVKGIHLEGLRKIGNPNEYAVAYYQHGIDELIYEDIVASLYNRNSLLDVIEKTTNSIFVPIIVGGGLRAVDDVSAVLRAGADKISINSEALKRPKIISEVANRFGSQCMVLSVQAKQRGTSWEAYYDNGREPSGIDVLDWVALLDMVDLADVIDFTDVVDFTDIVDVLDMVDVAEFIDFADFNGFCRFSRF